MGEKDKQPDPKQPDPQEKEPSRVFSLGEELDAYDNLTVPVRDATAAAEQWKRENPQG